MWENNTESPAKNDTFRRHRKFTRPIAAPWPGLERRLAACGLDFLFHLKLRDDAKEVAGPEAVASGVSQTSKSLQSQATQANEKRKVACQQSCICGSFEIFGSEGRNMEKRSVFQVIVAWPCSCFDFFRPNL